MPREEIIGGLKNALERGDSLEKAVQSFVNSGYNPQEVRTAANDLSHGATAIVHRQEKGSEEELPELPAKKKKSKTKIILIIAIILFLLILIRAVLFTVFSPETVRKLIG